MPRMNDEEWEAQKDRWMSLTRDYLPALMLRHWNITYHWFDEPLDARQPSDRHGPTSICETKDGTPAHVFVQAPYMAADVEVDLRIVRDLDDGQVRLLWFHEHAHIILGQLGPARGNREAYRQAEEAAAQWIAKVLEGLTAPDDNGNDGTVNEIDYRVHAGEDETAIEADPPGSPQPGDDGYEG